MLALKQEAVVVGAGIGGLVSAALLAARGCGVLVLERAAAPGGKAGQVEVDGARVDAGPTVFTLREVFDEVFAACGTTLDDWVSVRPAEVIARHAWSSDERLDLYADSRRSEAAIAAFSGIEGVRGYRSFHAEAARIYRILDRSFLRGDKVSWPGPLMWRIGPWRIADLIAIRPYESLWRVLGEHFADQRLRQLYARYATYCGSSPFAAPATLMLIAHVEARGVWLIDGGLAALAEALRRLAESMGAKFRFEAEVAEIAIEKGRASAVTLASGERFDADAVIVNADPAALADGRFGPQAARAVRRYPPQHRSLSAFTWLAHARTSGFPLSRHNVFFSSDYRREFADIAAGRPPAEPSVYVCAQDRHADGTHAAPGERERLQIIVNAPANGDSHHYNPEEKERCTQAMRARLARCGLELEEPLPHILATPNEFAARFPSTGGAIYGRASHGWAASFLRQGARTRIPGLYCAGGSTHPGAGVPMAALSGGLAVQAVMRDLASMRRFHLAATAGGMSTPSATTAATG
jgi:1-hydroxycarotenoid 3,4-desaturase